MNLHVGNGVKVDVLFIGTVVLHFRCDFRIILENTAFVPSMRRSLVSLSKLDESGYHFHFGNKNVEVSLNSSIVGECLLRDGLYQLDLNSDAIAFHVDNEGTKRALMKENSYSLWHKRLGHISQERIERLIKSQILPQLVYDNIESCVDCIKGKLTKIIKQQGATRSSELLELIHIEISGPYSHSLCGKSFFVTFIDDFSRYGYVYLISHKSEALERFKIFKTEVEKQLEKVIKIVRSNRGGEYYGRHGDLGQCLGPFAEFLQSCGIKAEYTMVGTPEQNGVSERRNRTLMDMVRSMISRTKLPQSFWGEALQIAM